MAKKNNETFEQMMERDYQREIVNLREIGLFLIFITDAYDRFSPELFEKIVKEYASDVIDVSSGEKGIKKLILDVLEIKEDN